MYQALLLLLVFSHALALPNPVPKHQQEIIQDPLEPNNGLYTSSTIRDVLLANQVIPQVLDDFEPIYYLDIAYPKKHQRVLLGNTIKVKAVSKRPVFTFHPLTGPPSYGDPPNKKNLTFTLILTDPDALSRKHPVKSEMCHWILTNLTTPLLASQDFDWIEFGTNLEAEYFENTESLPWLYFGNIVYDPENDEFVEDQEVDCDDHSPALLSKKKPGEVESYFPPAPPKKTGPHRYVFVLLEGDVSSLKPPKERPHWGYGKERHGVRDWAAENNLTVVGANFFFAQHKKQ